MKCDVLGNVEKNGDKNIFTHHNSRDWASTDGIESHSTESVNVGVWWRPTKYRKWNVNIGVCSNTRTGSLEKEDFSKIKARRCLIFLKLRQGDVCWVGEHILKAFLWCPYKASNFSDGQIQIKSTKDFFWGLFQDQLKWLDFIES